MSDRETLDVYNAKVDDYAKMVSDGMPNADLQRFLDRLPDGATVLDWGCGTGNSAIKFKRAGHQITATDASAEMVAYANENYDVDAQLATFDQLDSVDAYDGIWANFSLLHEPRDAMPGHLACARSALKPGGVLHLGMKLGEGAHRDSLGRFYCYYGEDELKSLLTAAGFTPSFSRTGVTEALAGGKDPFIIVIADG